MLLPNLSVIQKLRKLACFEAIVTARVFIKLHGCQSHLIDI